MRMLQTEFSFTLPVGYVDPQGNLHREGKMRLASAIDEIAPLRDLRVKANEAYLTILLLSNVVTQLGTLRQVDAGVVERLFSADLAFLQDFYRAINGNGARHIEMECPHCLRRFESEVVPLGG
jgi:hypothetical protein